MKSKKKEDGLGVSFGGASKDLEVGNRTDKNIFGRIPASLAISGLLDSSPSKALKKSIPGYASLEASKHLRGDIFDSAFATTATARLLDGSLGKVLEMSIPGYASLAAAKRLQGDNTLDSAFAIPATARLLDGSLGKMLEKSMPGYASLAAAKSVKGDISGSAFATTSIARLLDGSLGKVLEMSIPGYASLAAAKPAFEMAHKIFEKFSEQSLSSRTVESPASLLFNEVLEWGVRSYETEILNSSPESNNILSDLVQDIDAGISLPDNTKKSLLQRFQELPQFIQTVIIFFFCSIFFEAIKDYGKEKILDQIHSLEAYATSKITGKSLTRTDILLQNNEIDWEYLNQFRIISSENVNLRISASMNGRIIDVLNKNTIVLILDKKDRSWLYVQTRSQGEIIRGWVNRSFTKQIGR